MNADLLMDLIIVAWLWFTVMRLNTLEEQVQQLTEQLYAMHILQRSKDNNKHEHNATVRRF